MNIVMDNGVFWYLSYESDKRVVARKMIRIRNTARIMVRASSIMVLVYNLNIVMDDGISSCFISNLCYERSILTNIID